LALLALPAANALGQNQAEKAEPKDYYLIQNQKTLAGQLLSFDDNSKSISVRIDFPEWVPNPNYRPNTGAQHNLVVDYNRMQQEAQRLAASKNPKQAQQHYVQIMQLQVRIAQEMARLANGGPNSMPFKQVHHTKDFDFDMQDSVVYRKMFLPMEYDDTGNLKTYSKDKLTELRGKNDPKGSYAATASEFHPGQYVWVYVNPPKKDGSASSTASLKDKTENKDNKDGKMAEDPAPRPVTRMLVITQEGNLPASTGNAKKK
jgi:hypothetical protein